MKNLMSLGRRILIVKILWILGCSVLAQSESLHFAADPWCPFTCDPKAEKKGIFLDVVREIYEGAGIQVIYDSAPWARAVVDTREGRMDGILGALKADAPDFIFPVVSWANQKSCFYVKAGSKWTYRGADDLRGVKVGGVQDYTYGDPFDSEAKKAKVLFDPISGTDTALRLFKKLADSRIEVVIEDESVASYVLASGAGVKASDFKKVGCLKSVPLFVAFSPKNPKSKEYAKILDLGFKKLGQKRLAEIRKKYDLR